MTAFKSVEEILQFAIGKEQEAVEFYTALASQVKNEVMARTLMDFAREERKHKEKLQAVKTGTIKLQPQAKIQDLKVADYLVDVDATPDMDYQKALILAMKKEKAAFKLYSDLAAQAADETVQALFLGLAQEEARHKLRFEIEYDERVLTSE